MLSNTTILSQLTMSNSQETYYTVYEYLSNGNILNSSFISKTKAFDYVNRFCEAASNVYIYKTKLIKHFASRLSNSSSPYTATQTVDTLLHAADIIDDPDYVPTEIENHEPLEYAEDDFDLTNLGFSDYGKGYLLRPNSSTSFYGEPYLMNGWWNPTLEGWFFKREYYSDLINAGAKYTGTCPPDIGSEANPIVVSDSEPEPNLSGLYFEDHGKGFVLTPLKDTPFRGEKYLLNGWWMPSVGGWFFRRREYDDLIAHGATYAHEDITIKTEIDLSGMQFRNYKRGFLLKPRKNHSYDDDNYLLDGFWNDTLNGWVFRRNTDIYNQLITAGAEYLGDASEFTTSSSASESSTIGPSPFEKPRNLSKFMVKSYGKGLIVKCAKTNSLYKQQIPYLLGNLGYWNTNADGWFFQTQYLKSLLDLGTRPIGRLARTKNPLSTRSTNPFRNVDYVCDDTKFYN